MLKQLRHTIVNALWERYRAATPQMQRISQHLKQQGVTDIVLDHFAVIDLPGPHSGIPHLHRLFTHLGYQEQGKGYLPDKQNDFLWMAETDSMHLPAPVALPQVVIADFRLEELPPEVKSIIEKYSQKTTPLAEFKHLSETECANYLLTYLRGRDWPLPTVKEFRIVQEFNELLAWVLIFGRRANHFTVSVHHLTGFSNITEFLHLLEDTLQFNCNQEGGKIKGSEQAGIEQGSTAPQPEIIPLSDGNIALPTGFIEFVWRYPKQTTMRSPLLWSDYFTDFIGQYADRVIESLYLKQKQDILCESSRMS